MGKHRLVPSITDYEKKARIEGIAKAITGLSLEDAHEVFGAALRLVGNKSKRSFKIKNFKVNIPKMREDGVDQEALDRLSQFLKAGRRRMHLQIGRVIFDVSATEVSWFVLDDD